MINGFHMNPLWYLATLPICAVSIFSMLMIDFLIIGIIASIIVLTLLVFLYINNIIGLLDMIFLGFICLLGINPGFSYTIWLNIILIPLAIGLSYALK